MDESKRRLRSTRNRKRTQHRARRGRSSRIRRRTMKGGFKITVTCVLKSKKHKQFNVDGDMTVAALKTMLAHPDQLGLPSVNQRVMLESPDAPMGYRELNDNDTLAHSGVVEGSKLAVILRTHGSVVGPKDPARAIWS